MSEFITLFESYETSDVLEAPLFTIELPRQIILGILTVHLLLPVGI